MTRTEKRRISETMDSIMMPLIQYLDEQTKEVVRQALRILRDDVAIKTLEQEIALDKIRAEIIENSIKDYEYHGCGTDELIIETSEVLQIIDKYKADMRGEEV